MAPRLRGDDDPIARYTSPMKIASWNVNSLNVRLPHLTQWLQDSAPDVVALQETKLEDERFPDTQIASLGYRSVFAGQKTYNGVALLARNAPIEDVQVGMPGFEDEQRRVIAATIGGVRVVNFYVVNGQAVGSAKFEYKLRWLEAAGYHVAYSGQSAYNGVAILSRAAPTAVVMGIPGFQDEQKRMIAATIDGVRVVCVYIPNGQSLDSDKYPYKLSWLEALTAWLKDELSRQPQLALLGDYNIAPEDADVHDPKAWEGNVLVSPPEREAFRQLLDLGLTDSYRLFEQAPASFSWWDYRMNGFRRNLGLRIDHILVSSPLAARAAACRIDKGPRALERPSDHAPVLLELHHS